MSAIPVRLIIPGRIPIKLQRAVSVSSAHARPGDRLDFVVVRDVSVEGFAVIPAESSGVLDGSRFSPSCDTMATYTSSNRDASERGISSFL